MLKKTVTLVLFLFVCHELSFTTGTGSELGDGLVYLANTFTAFIAPASSIADRIKEDIRRAEALIPELREAGAHVTDGTINSTLKTHVVEELRNLYTVSLQLHNDIINMTTHGAPLLEKITLYANQLDQLTSTNPSNTNNLL